MRSWPMTSWQKSVPPAKAQAAERTAGGQTTAGPVILPRWAAAVGTVLVFLFGQGIAVVLLPYPFTHWQQGTPPWPVVVRGIGVALIAAGGLVVIWGFVRFAAEGVGVPVPVVEPTSRRLTVGGPYRYVRHPLYLAIVVLVTGQGLLLSRPELMIYAAVLLVAFVAFVHWYEDPSLARRFGEQWEAYRQQVPGWWPRVRPRPARGLPAIALRPATPADNEFCFQLHKAAMGDYVAAIWGWDEQAQRDFHDRAFNPDRGQIITADGADAGMLAVEYRPDEIYLARIEVDPRYQGRGIGTRLIRALLDEADHAGQDLVLDVLTVNHRAQALYQRLGMREVARHGHNNIKITMRSARPHR
jgi:protein-S-isoprenylcysteine O-methyltransferase Ste14/GNAT superfamily N-acetyltransferase